MGCRRTEYSRPGAMEFYFELRCPVISDLENNTGFSTSELKPVLLVKILKGLFLTN
jgi:hypothetical protein